MLKKILCLLLAVLMLMAFPACQSEKDDDSDDTTPDSDSGSVKQLTISKGDDIDYKVILVQGCSTSVSTASSLLLDAVKEVAGKKPTRTYDNTDKNPETKKEILLGLTNRDESQEAMEGLQAGEYLVEVRGDKIVVLGANDYAMMCGIQALIDSFHVDGDKLTIDYNLSIRENVLDEQFALLKDGKFIYSIIAQAGLDEDAQNATSDFASKVKNLFDCERISTRVDTAVDADDDAYEILIGMTNRKESQDAYANMTTLGYGISVEGKKITVIGTNSEMISRALSALFVELKNIKEGTLKGEYMMSSGFSSVVDSPATSGSWFKAVPVLTGGQISTGHSIDEKSVIIERCNAVEKDFTDYVAALDAAGFTDGEDYTLGNNRYVLRYGEKATVFLAYSAKAKTLRLYAEQPNLYNYPEKNQKGTVNTYEPKMWQLRVDNITSRQNGGMSYVFLLADGTFFIIDGGYQTADEARNLYNFLKEKNPLEGDPVVTAWYFSHTHGDHIGAIQEVATRYYKSMDVKSFYYHFEPGYPSGFKNATAKWPNAVHYARLHSGMQVELPGLSFNVLYTLEDQYPNMPENSNDFSAVIQVEIKGQKITFLGDVQKEACDVMLKYQGNEVMKSDVVQFSHHGYEGGTLGVYEAIAAPTVLWPMNIVSTQESYKSICNVFKSWYNKGTGGEGFLANYYMSHQAPYCKQIIIAGASEYQEMTFPYTPVPYTDAQSGTNGRLPNLDKLYNELKPILVPNPSLYPFTNS